MIDLKKGVSTPLAITITVVLTIIVGGGIFAYQYYYLPKQEIEMSKLETPKDETANWKTYRNEEVGIEFNYPKNFIPYLRDNEYIGDQPARFTSGKDSYAPLYENSTFVIMVAGAKEANQTIDQAAENSAYHKLRPFGENPIIDELQIGGQDARVITPSDPSYNEAEIIVKLKNPVLVGDNYWTFLVIYASQDLSREVIKTISESLHFL